MPFYGSPEEMSSVSLDGAELCRNLNEAANPPIAAIGLVAKTVRAGLKEENQMLAAQSYAA